MKKTSIPLVRELASRYSHDELEHCITQQLTDGVNPCLAENDPDTVVAILAQASYVSEWVKKGFSLPQGMRALGAQRRQFSGGKKASAP